jgi:hypothetical protein
MSSETYSDNLNNLFYQNLTDDGLREMMEESSVSFEEPSKVLLAGASQAFPAKSDCCTFDDRALNNEIESLGGLGFGFENSPPSSSSVEMSPGISDHLNILNDPRNYVPDWDFGIDELKSLLPNDVSKIPMAAPSAKDPEKDMCEVLHPIEKTPFMVPKKLLVQFLEQNGRKVHTYSKDSAKIQALIEQFCDHAHIEGMTRDHARMIKNSGYIIDVLSTKKGKSGKYQCLFCPLIGSMTKSFPNKENLIRHNALHLRYNKFQCGHCSYRHFRKDTIDQHITLKHPTKEKIILKLSK